LVRALRDTLQQRIKKTLQDRRGLVRVLREHPAAQNKGNPAEKKGGPVRALKDTLQHRVK
jgi:hypothetical protein